MLHACVQRFNVTENLEKFCKILETKQALSTQRMTPKQTIHGLIRCVLVLLQDVLLL